jgi:hypothetical protein
MSTGLIVANTDGLQNRFVRPSGAWAVAMEWELITKEAKPRLIFGQRSVGAKPKEVQ